MKSHITRIKITLSLLFGIGLIHPVLATTTMVTDASGTEELWSFEEILGANKLVSKINQIDQKGISQTWDANGNLVSRTDAQGRTTHYTYNATNQRTHMIEAVGTEEARETRYEYVSPDIDLVFRTYTPSIYPNRTRRVYNAYDDDLNIRATVINGYNVDGELISRRTDFKHDSQGKIIQVNGPRTDLNDITNIEYYDCNTGAECGQLKQVTNALGHSTYYNQYDAAGRVLESTDANGVVTTYIYHPRGWLLSQTQTHPNSNLTTSNGAVRITHYRYDHAGQLTGMTFPDGSEISLFYDAAHDLREVSDNLGNRIKFRYDAKGNRIEEEVQDPDGSLVSSLQTSYDLRNFVESINAAGSVTQLLNDAVGNLGKQTDPNQNPDTQHSYDSLDRLTVTLDALGNPTHYGYNVADQLTAVTAPNGVTTHYEYDDLGNQTKEISPDRGTLLYSHDAAGNIISLSDDRGITRTYTYDALNRLLSISYPDASENITYQYDSAENCGAGIGRLCQINDQSGQTFYEYDPWGNVLTQTKLELDQTYITRYQYDAMNRVTQMIYPNGRIVNYMRDEIGRVSEVTTTVNGVMTTVSSNRQYRVDGHLTQHTLANGLVESRSYDLQGRVTQIALGDLETHVYSYDANGNLLAIDKPIEGRVQEYDALDRLITDRRGETGLSVGNYALSYDANSNRLSRNNRTYDYLEGSNQISRDEDLMIERDEIGNTLVHRGNRFFAYNQAGRLETVHIGTTLKASYTYNAFGQRSRKDIPNRNSQLFHYDLQGNLLMRSAQHSSPMDDYIWVDGQPLQYTTLTGRIADGSIRTEKAKTYFTTDHLGTPRLGTNNEQVISWRWDSDGFGISLPDADPDGDGNRVIIFLRFPGQYYDSESILHYNWHRYYDRRSGRYITSDPIGLQGGLNTFGYVGGDPLGWVDRDGLSRRPFNPFSASPITLVYPAPRPTTGGAGRPSYPGEYRGGGHRIPDRRPIRVPNGFDDPFSDIPEAPFCGNGMSCKYIRVCMWICEHPGQCTKDRFIVYTYSNRTNFELLKDMNQCTQVACRFKYGDKRPWPKIE